MSENWVLRFNSLKRLYRLLTQYFEEVLQKPTTTLDVPNLQAAAKGRNIGVILCRMTLAITVQCEKNREIIERIQRLDEDAQHYLMKVIEQVRVAIGHP